MRYPGRRGRFTVWDVALTLEPGTISASPANRAAASRPPPRQPSASTRRRKRSRAHRFSANDLLVSACGPPVALGQSGLLCLAERVARAQSGLDRRPAARAAARRHLGLKGAALLRRSSCSSSSRFPIRRMRCALPVPVQRRPAAARRARDRAGRRARRPDPGRADHGSRRHHAGAHHGGPARDRRRDSLAVLYVSHDLALLGNLSDRVAIMYAGELVEEGPTAEVVRSPRHPYTEILLGPSPRPAIRASSPASRASRRPASCSTVRLRARCPYAFAACRRRPHRRASATGACTRVRCVRADELEGVAPAPGRDEPPARSRASEPLLIVDQLDSPTGAPTTQVGRQGFVPAARGRAARDRRRERQREIVDPADDRRPDRAGGRLYALRQHAPRRPGGGASEGRFAATSSCFQNPDASLNPRHTIRQSDAAVSGSATTSATGARGASSARASTREAAGLLRPLPASSRAVSASASRSPAPSWRSRGCCSATRSPRRSTSRCRRRSSS